VQRSIGAARPFRRPIPGKSRCPYSVRDGDVAPVLISATVPPDIAYR
jgi:hypothetical protein